MRVVVGTVSKTECSPSLATPVPKRFANTIKRYKNTFKPALKLLAQVAFISAAWKLIRVFQAASLTVRTIHLGPSLQFLNYTGMRMEERGRVIAVGVCQVVGR